MRIIDEMEKLLRKIKKKDRERLFKVMHALQQEKMKGYINKKQKNDLEMRSSVFKRMLSGVQFDRTKHQPDHLRYA